ncbi:MAG: DUF4126 domain-containing protein [Deltaproteobacteria bacterium]|nr:MAG: DUF4126 domain-containing protein [Deltaproteobacteria bacterium]
MTAQLALWLASSAGAGVNLYLTLLCLGLYARLGSPAEPLAGWLAPFGSPWVLVPAGVLFLLELVADKVPALDHLWDALHTLVRPAGAVFIALALTEDVGTAGRLASALGAGAVAFGFHGAKAGARVTARMNPEPTTNALASPALSVVEDLSVGGLLLLAITHPIAALLVLGVLILLLLYFGPRLWSLALFSVSAGFARLAALAGDTHRPDLDRVPHGLYQAIARRNPGPLEMCAGCWVKRPGLFNYRKGCLVVDEEAVYVAFRRFFLAHVIELPRPKAGAGGPATPVHLERGLLADRMHLAREGGTLRLLFLTSQRPWTERLLQRIAGGSPARSAPAPTGLRAADEAPA